MHLIAKHGIALTGAKSHHQGDAGSFSLFAFGQLLAIDPGYPGAAQSDVVNKPTDHNLILINGNGPNPPYGEFVNTNTNTAYIENCFDSPSLGYGEVQTSYHGANITRKLLFMHKKYFISGDFVTSTALNNYTFQLHGNGLSGALPSDATGAFYPDFENRKCTYQRDSVHLLAMVQNDGSAADFTTATDSLATIEGVYRHYTKTLVTKNNASNMLYVTTLYPWMGSQPVVTQIGEADSFVANRINDGIHTDYLFAQRDNLQIILDANTTGLPETIRGNGNLNLYSTQADGSFASAFIQNGDSLVYGFQPIIKCDKKLDVVFEKITGGIYTGHISAAGVVALYSAYPLRAVAGSVSSVTFDAAKKLCLISFTGKCNFRLEPSDGLWDESSLSSLKLEVFPNPSPEGHFAITIYSRARSKATLTITDNTGHTIVSRNSLLQPGKTLIHIDLSGFPTGVYWLRCTLGSGSCGVGLVK
jgi:hypothetical protein